MTDSVRNACMLNRDWRGDEVGRFFDRLHDSGVLWSETLGVAVAYKEHLVGGKAVTEYDVVFVDEPIGSDDVSSYDGFGFFVDDPDDWVEAVNALTVISTASDWR